MAESIANVLTSPLARKLLGHEARIDEDQLPFLLDVITRLDFLLRNPSNRQPLFDLGNAALDAFLQANVTGPPLEFNSVKVIFPQRYLDQPQWETTIRQVMLNSLAIEGEAIYPFTPHIELFWLAKQILSQKDLGSDSTRISAHARANFTHHRLLQDRANSLQKQILRDYDALELTLRSKGVEQEHELEELVSFYVERAAVYIYFGLDNKARQDLTHAADINWFDFRLTGWLGKRTRFQDRDISQLIVLAKSSITKWKPNTINSDILGTRKSLEKLPQRTEPINLDLNDDTLLESISFTKAPTSDSHLTEIHDIPDLPISLKAVDPASQPKLEPLDAIILLNLASSISNTSPSDGLTREETLPYATRVLEGGSSNWQIYTQALLVRSRIEGYKSRTAQRGLLQLQALVDQVITETTGVAPIADAKSEAPTAEVATSSEVTTTPPDTFLPKPKPGESAPVAERLKYIWQLNCPMRWELEAELAARWVQIGGLRTALDIYRRLHMKAELALCLAATDKEGEAIREIRQTLFEPNAAEASKPEAEKTFRGALKETLPTDAPRLLCILGDLEKDPQHYETAWSVSGSRYARAQRSLGRYFAQAKKYRNAEDAYRRALHVARLDARTWFALGAIQLELQDWPEAVDSFTHAVRLEDLDAEAWSNLAAALLRLPPDAPPSNIQGDGDDSLPLLPDDEEEKEGGEDPSPPTVDPHRHLHAALHALRRAAALSPSSARIWDNYLTVSASIPPPSTPYNDIILAQRRVIELRGPAIGDVAVDEAVLRMLVRRVTAWEGGIPPTRTREVGGEGMEGQKQGEMMLSRERRAQVRNLVGLVEECVRPVVTRNVRLWGLVAELEEWRGRPGRALEAEERLWRGLVANGGGGGGGGEGQKEGMGREMETETETEEGWERVVEGTLRLVRAYERLGMRVKEREGEGEGAEEGGKENEGVGEGKAEGEGIGEGEGEGELVAKDWKFKARSALRSVKGKGKEEEREGTEGWRRLEECVEGLKGR